MCCLRRFLALHRYGVAVAGERREHDMSSNTKVTVPAEGVRIDGPDGVIRIAVPANAEAIKVNARRRAVQAFGAGGIKAIGKVPTPRTAKVNGTACLVFDFAPVTVTQTAPAKGRGRINGTNIPVPPLQTTTTAKVRGKAKADGVDLSTLSKAELLALLSGGAVEAKAERTPGRWSGVTCRTCRDFGFVKATANAAGRVTYRSAKGAAESVVDGRGVACPDHTQGTDAHAKATRKAVKAARATYAAAKAAAAAASA